MDDEPKPTPVPPKRGGIHPTYGKFIGGAKLTDEYKLAEVTSGSHFRFFTQRRHEKTIATIERDLRDARDSTTSIKFNGTIDPTEGNANEIGKERFITLLKKRVKEYGQQTFYWIRDSEGKVVDLFEHAHRFKLDEVVAEHIRRCVKNDNEESYDDIERDEVELSRTVVESLLTESFQEKLEIRFNHREDFESLPGSCLFIMALETCNASVFHDIEGAKKKLEALDLNSYPGENVTEFASDAQRFVKVMQAGYSVPLGTGSTIVGKLTGTASEFFNRKMWALLDVVLTAELEFELSDPKLFVKHKNYATLGPLGVIATIQATHGMLLSQHRWPALADTLPQGNNAAVNGGTGTGGAQQGSAGTPASALNGRRCYRCNGDHLVRDCPQPAPDGSTGGTNAGAARTRTPLADWKYQKPTDVTVPRVDANGKIWKFCSKCKCRATGKLGYYQLSHYEADHVDNYRRTGSSSRSSGAANSNATAPPEVPTAPATAPQSNLLAGANPNPIPPGPPDVTTREPAESSNLDDELVFNGMWHTEVDDTDIGWVTVPFKTKTPTKSNPSECYTRPSVWVASITDHTVDANSAVTQVSYVHSSSSVERERISVETINEDDEDDDFSQSTSDVSACTYSDELTTTTLVYPDDFPSDDSTADPDYPTDDESTYSTVDSTGHTTTATVSTQATQPDESTLAKDIVDDLMDFRRFEMASFVDAHEVEPTVTNYRGTEFFDTVESPPSFPSTWFRPLPSHWLIHTAMLWSFWITMIHTAMLWSFWITMLAWDLVLHFLDKPPPVPRRIRRQKQPTTIPSYPSKWMILTGCLMILMSVFQGQAPHIPIPNMSTTATYLHQGGKDAYDRVTLLDDMVVLNLETFVQYQGLKLKATRDILAARNPSTVSSAVLTPKELDEFFDCYETLPIETGDAFFDAIEDDGTSSFDPFAIHELCQGTSCVDCVVTSNTTEIEKDQNNAMANGPTILHQSLTDEVFTMLATDPHALISIGGGQRQAVIFDTGASLGITFEKEDFDGPLTIPEGDLRLGGMASGLKIEGIGPVTWTFRNEDGTELQIRSQCYYVPAAKVRLISPQRLFNKSKGVIGKFQGDEESFNLEFEGCQRLVVEYDPRNHLPIGYATIGESSPTISAHQANLALLDAENQNLTAGHKLLLNWHGRFGHLNFQAVQRILRQFPFQSAKFAAAAKCDLTDLRCEICQYAKAHRRTTHGKRTQPNDDREGALKTEHLDPGARVSVDHFESRVLGRTKDSYGKATSDKYKGGCIFVDHSTGYLHVEHQLGFSAVETLRAKQSYEKMAFEHGVVVQSYLTDSGAFKANTFVQHIRDHGQRIQYCGTNAHHQNGVAERSIRTVSNMARAMLLHSAAHWKEGVDASIWPMAVSYAVYVYNNTPNAQNLCPADLYTGSMVPRHRLRDFHTWGCPVYVLDPTLQAGKKLPRWEPRSRRGVFVGLSTIHSSEVPMVLNLSTGSITTQYHVVFDDRFTTVESIGLEDTPPSYWEELCLENTMYVPTDGTPDQPVHLHDDFLTETERELKYRSLQRQHQIRQTQHPTAQKKTTDEIKPLSRSRMLQTEGERSQHMPSESTDVQSSPPDQDATISDPPIAILPTPKPTAAPYTPKRKDGVHFTPPTASGELASTPSADSSRIRRSTRENLGRPATKYMDESYLTTVERLDQIDPYVGHLVYLAEVATCCDTGIENVVDPRAYAAKTNVMNPDMPTFHQAMNGEHSEQYIKAMQLEIATLVEQRTWTLVPRTPDLNVLKGTWVFKLKRLPDGTPSRFKARYCARGDLQQEGVDFFDTYAPVVQWSTIRMLLTTVLTEGWATRQVDYTNAFAQADLREEVYVECPKMFAPKSGIDLVLKLIKSLYGLRQAPRTFFEKLREGLLERGYSQSANDPCLFMKKGIICVVYVDDTIFAGADTTILEEEIRSLGVSDTEQRHTFQLRDEGEVGAFLGIQITKIADTTFELKQTGLIDKVLKTADMSDCNGVSTPTGSVPVGSDEGGIEFSESWKYRTVIGMLMYLSANTRPDIAFAVHQAARFSHAPKHSHAVAVKRILRYLKETHDKGMIMTPTSEQRVDCYVDSDFAGAFAVENSQDPASVKSRTGYIIMYRSVPLLWVSKMQTQVALSTMEAEYVALSQSMRDLIPVRQILQEIMTIVFEKQPTIVYHSHSKAFDEVNNGSLPSTIEQSTVYEDNQACLKFARMAQLSPRTKHIGIPYHWFRSKVESLEIRIEPIATTKQLADPFTKGLGIVPFELSRRSIMGW